MGRPHAHVRRKGGGAASTTSIIRPSIIRNLDYPAWKFSKKKKNSLKMGVSAAVPWTQNVHLLRMRRRPHSLISGWIKAWFILFDYPVIRQGSGTKDAISLSIYWIVVVEYRALKFCWAETLWLWKHCWLCILVILSCLFSCQPLSVATAPIYTTFKDAKLYFLQIRHNSSFVCLTVSLYRSNWRSRPATAFKGHTYFHRGRSKA